MRTVRCRRNELLPVVVGLAGLLWLSSAAMAQQSFTSPDDAATALAAAVKSGKPDILKVLAFCFKLVNTNAHNDPAAARTTLKQLESMK